jgi:hypothetical protein
MVSVPRPRRFGVRSYVGDVGCGPCMDSHVFHITMPMPANSATRSRRRTAVIVLNACMADRSSRCLPAVLEQGQLTGTGPESQVEAIGGPRLGGAEGRRVEADHGRKGRKWTRSTRLRGTKARDDEEYGDATVEICEVLVRREDCASESLGRTDRGVRAGGNNWPVTFGRPLPGLGDPSTDQRLSTCASTHQSARRWTDIYIYLSLVSMPLGRSSASRRFSREGCL